MPPHTRRVTLLAHAALAYDALRLVFFPWQRERRIARECERTRIARMPRMFAAGFLYSVAIRRDGTTVLWGKIADMIRTIPTRSYNDCVNDGDLKFAAIERVAAGKTHLLQLLRNGSVVCWGDNDEGQAPPEGVEGDFVEIAAGRTHSMALRRDGSGIACWGYNEDGQAPPEGVNGDLVAISAGTAHSLALRRDGSIEGWGCNLFGEAPPDGRAGPFGRVDV